MIATRHHQQSGFALILVLSFVVLITFVVVAFFSDSIFERRVSNGSANQSKVEIFARGALDTTVGDLRQEIVDGSTQVSANSTTTTPPYIYLPKPATAGVPSTMVPAYQITTGFKPTFNSSGLETDGMANVLKLSASGVPFYAQTANTNAGLSRACSVSTTTPSQNGHYISPARWNTPLLMPATSLTDTTPTATGFTAPNWILVANNSVTNPTTVSSNVVGRYAYTIYNEGGLLDMNMAGYPVETAPVLASHKMGVSLADLTQVGLTTAQIDTILGWRNNASAQPTGSYPSYTFNTTSGLNYFDAMFGNAAGFMSISNTSLTSTNLSDQRFISRQHLINFLLQGVSNGTPTTQLQGALQYLGTFSRTVDQPSYQPNPNADPNYPKVQYSSFLTTQSPTTFPAQSSGGNTAYGSDSVVNPFFLQVPVTASFVRNDGVTNAVVGEPLVKTRFGLNRLAWVTYKGPSATLYASNPSDPVITAMLAQGIPLQMIKNGTPANVQAYFGLQWGPNNYWIYQPPNNETVARIDKFSDIQGLNKPREANFFELLKAAITVGSLGKASASTQSGTLSALDINQYNNDTSTDYQILQIGANIIDQFDSDSYPTHIQFSTSTVTQDFYGDENIPYLYRTRAVAVNASGTGLILMLPEVWNPHSPSSNTPSAAPTSFRLLTVSPLQAAISTSARCRGYPNGNSASPELIGIQATANTPSPFSLDASPSVASGSSKTELDFTVPLGTMAQQYYEPFFIGGEYNSSGPVGTASIGNGSYTPNAYGDGNRFITDTASSYKYCGVQLATFLLSFQSANYTVKSNWTFTTTPTWPLPTPTYSTLNPSTVDMCNLSTGGGVVYYLQYQDASGAWQTYLQDNASLPTTAQVSCVRGSNNSALPTYQDISVAGSVTLAGVTRTMDTGECLTWMDPRTSRFGPVGTGQERLSTALTATAGYYGLSNQPCVGPTGTLSYTFGQSSYISCPGTGISGNNQLSTGAAAIGWYPGNWSIGNNLGTQMFVPAYYAQNVTGNQYSPQSNGNYYADPDGVVRRAMGGYAGAAPSTSTNGLPHAALSLSATQSLSRPFLLNRPFRSVAELGYTFSGTPWRNVDFIFPESGYSALLDVFCINETPDPNSLKAGKVDLNTRQLPVLEAILSGMNNQGFAYKDEANSGVVSTTTSLNASEAQQIATALVTRTTATSTGSGALANVSELVGKWNSSVTVSGATAPFNIDGSKSYTGFSADLTTVFNATDTTKATTNIARLRESAIRALADAGQTRTWNLMIDLVAQTGRYRTGETSLSNFIVDGEQRYWLHVAIDRYTGKVVDEQLERVKE